MSPLPALLLTMVSSRDPRAMRASMSSDGMPAVPNPPIMTVAPSNTSATAASADPTVLSIKVLSSFCVGSSAVRTVGFAVILDKLCDHRTVVRL